MKIINRKFNRKDVTDLGLKENPLYCKLDSAMLDYVMFQHETEGRESVQQNILNILRDEIKSNYGNPYKNSTLLDIECSYTLDNGNVIWNIETIDKHQG